MLYCKFSLVGISTTKDGCRKKLICCWVFQPIDNQQQWQTRQLLVRCRLPTARMPHTSSIFHDIPEIQAAAAAMRDNGNELPPPKDDFKH
jgi:hypothetical protein